MVRSLCTITVLIVKSGNEKTTLTRVINGLVSEYYPGDLSGEILINSHDVSNMPIRKRSKQIGSVFQDPISQFFSSEMSDEIAFALENYGVSKSLL